MRAASILLSIVLVIAAVTTYFTKFDPIQNHMKLGLDLKGGVHIVLEGVNSDVGQVTPETLDAAQKVIENRINRLGLSEPVIQNDKKSRIIVQLAGETDVEKAKEMIGKTAALKFMDESGATVLDGKDVEKAGVATQQQQGGYIVTLKLKGQGPEKFAKATKDNIGKRIAIMLDEEVISAPTVQSEITNGEAIITGNFDAKSATQLSDLINGGALPIKLEMKEVRLVTATLGADSLSKSAKAGVIGLLGVVLFMLVMYRLPGVMANIALVIYTLLTIGFLVGINAVFTLPGLAGLLLSIGMAVDGNVIIFERIKEELRKGKGLRAGIDAGFNRAIHAVVDGQVTTAIAGIVLWYLGTGPIKGFALTLVVGTALSMFTAVTVSKWLIHLLVAVKQWDRSLFGVKEVAR